ncbi:MAG: ribosome small subunit-dependent GTPase A [Treponema sp.]|jgi:ribosome biogenesis GTPase|nr:ribosome small subunit-dependent GTPase A [Treponema sp.]
MQGIVIGGSKNIFSVECDDNVTRQCTIKGKKLKTEDRFYNPLAAGDFVNIEPDEKNNELGQIISLEPRKNAFVRWNVKGRAPQLLAANVDRIFCVTTPDEPPFRPRFVDRMLIQADAANIEPVILCNKCDLPIDSDVDFRLAEWERIGYTMIKVSAKTGEGMSQLATMLEGKRSVFAGQSGVGKSSIVNVLDSSVVLKTGSLSEKYGRGTHTTTRGMLYHLRLNESLMDGRMGATADIIDTPGVRRFVLDGIDADDIILYFREIAPIVGTCTFGMSCTHTKEAGCRVLEAVHAGVISEERFESYERIKEEILTGNWKD